MPKSKNRIVVNDLEVKAFNNPAQGSARNPLSLKTSNPQDKATNRILESFAGFSKALTSLGITNTKNDAAEELKKAKNLGLSDKFIQKHGFQFQKSADLYDATQGAFAGHKLTAKLGAVYTAALDHTRQQKLNFSDSNEFYDGAVDKGLSEAGINSEEYSKQSESYRSAFFQLVVNQKIEHKDIASKQFEADYITKRNMEVSAYVEMIADNAGQITEGDVGEDIVASVERNIHMASFINMRQNATNLNMAPDDATLHILTTLIQKSVTEGEPGFLRFTSERLPNGFKLIDNVKYGAIVSAGIKKAKIQRVYLNDQKFKRETRQRNEEQRISTSDLALGIYEDPTKEWGGVINEVAKNNNWTSEQIQNTHRLTKLLQSSDWHITADKEVELDLLIDAEMGLVSAYEVTQRYIQSDNLGHGINRLAMDRIMAVVQKPGGPGGAFAITLGELEELQASGLALLQRYGVDHSDKFRRIKAKMIRQFRESLIFWIQNFPEFGASSPEAIKFFQKRKTDIIAASPIAEELDADLLVKRPDVNEEDAQPAVVKKLDESLEDKQGRIDESKNASERRLKFSHDRIRGYK